MSEVVNEMQYLHAEVMRASKDVRRNPLDESARNNVERLRARFAAKKIENYVEKTLATAPPLSPEQRERLMQVVQHGGPA